MTPDLRRRLETHWAARLGCEVGVLREPGLHVLPEPRRDALYAVSLDASTIVCTPARYAAGIRREHPGTIPALRGVLDALLPISTRFIGPAFVGYFAGRVGYFAGRVAGIRLARDGEAGPRRDPAPMPSARGDAFEALRRAASAEEWEHAGLDTHVGPLFVECVDGEVVAAAGFETIRGEVAHIGVLTHPGHRATGLGRRVVAAATREALSRGLLAQYQTLLSNASAIAVARALGFEHFATTLAARIAPQN